MGCNAADLPVSLCDEKKVRGAWMVSSSPVSRLRQSQFFFPAVLYDITLRIFDIVYYILGV